MLNIGVGGRQRVKRIKGKCRGRDRIRGGWEERGKESKRDRKREYD